MALSARLRMGITAALVIVLIVLAVSFKPAEASTGAGLLPAPGHEGRLSIPGKGPAFLLAVNYEGPADRAWRMWEDGQFDPDLMDADLRRARDAGFSTVRIFVQPPLVKDVLANRWDKLDRFLDLANKHGLSVILSLYDYQEKELSRVADVDGRIAAHYVQNPVILAYDLRNEPHFSDLSSAVYPRGAKSPIQQASPADLLKSYQEMAGRAGAWATDRNYLVSTTDYLNSPEGRRWDPLLGIVNGSLEMWMKPQIEAIRKADDQRPITASYSDLILAGLPANGALDYITIHRYPSASGKALEGVGRTLSSLRSVFPGKPVLLGEFGFSTVSMTPEESANYEVALYLQLLSEGLAGGGKWMLNDFPSGSDPRQNSFGAYRGDGTAKPVVAAVRGLSDYLSTSPSKGGYLYAPDTGLPWDRVVARHLAFLDGNQVIKDRYLSDPDWLEHYGLPVAYADMGSSYVVRAQRATFQYWKEDVPWAKKGEITAANGGDLAKEAYFWPVEAVVPQAPPAR